MFQTMITLRGSFSQRFLEYKILRDQQLHHPLLRICWVGGVEHPDIISTSNSLPACWMDLNKISPTIYTPAHNRSLIIYDSNRGLFEFEPRSNTTFYSLEFELLFELLFSDHRIKTKQPQRQLIITVTTTAHHQHTTHNSHNHRIVMTWANRSPSSPLSLVAGVGQMLTKRRARN